MGSITVIIRLEDKCKAREDRFIKFYMGENICGVLIQDLLLNLVIDGDAIWQGKIPCSENSFPLSRLSGGLSHGEER